MPQADTDKWGRFKSFAEIFAVVASLSLPFILHLIWQFKNQLPPISDWADHSRVAYYIYLSFQQSLQKGWESVLYSTGKPILFSAWAAPFFSLAKTDVLLPQRIFLPLLVGLITLAYYWLFRIRLRRPMAALAACLIMTLPYVTWLSTMFMPENIWHLWFILFLSTTARAIGKPDGKFKTVWLFFSGLLLALTILARPVESLFIIGLPCIVLLFFFGKKFGISIGRDIAFPGALTIGCVAFSAFLNYRERTRLGLMVELLVCGILALPYVFWRSPVRNRYLRLFTAARFNSFYFPLVLLCGTWLLLHGKNIISWSVECAVGNMAKLADNENANKSFFQLLWWVLYNYGGVTFVGLFCLTILSFVRMRRKLQDHEAYLLKVVAVGVSAAFLPMVAVYTITGTGDPRRILLGSMSLLVGLLFTLFPMQPLPRRLRVGLCIGLVALIGNQILPLLSFFTNEPVLVKIAEISSDRLQKSQDYYTPRLGAPSSQEGHDTAVIREVQSLGINNAQIAVYSLGMFTKLWRFSVETMRFVTLGIDPSLNFGTLMGYAAYEPYSAVLERLKNNAYRYLILEDVDESKLTPATVKQFRSHTFFANEALAMAKADGGNLPGLKLLKKIHVVDRDVFIYKLE